MGLDAQLEWIECLDDIISERYGQRILGFWKDRSWGLTIEVGGWVFRIWSDQIGLGFNQQRWIKILDTPWVGYQHSMVNIGPNELCLSLCVT